MITRQECDRRRALGESSRIPACTDTLGQTETLREHDGVWDASLRCWLFASSEARDAAWSSIARHPNRRVIALPRQSDAMDDLDSAMAATLGFEWIDRETGEWTDF